MFEQIIDKCNKIPQLNDEIENLKKMLIKIDQSENIKEIRRRCHSTENQLKENGEKTEQLTKVSKLVNENLNNIKDEINQMKAEVIVTKERRDSIHSTSEISRVPTNDKTEDEIISIVATDAPKPKSQDSTKKADIWIVGSSVVKDLDGRKMYRNKRTCITTLRDKTIQGATDFIKSRKINSDIIMLQIGSNDLDDQELQVGEIFETYEDLVDIPRREYPSAKLILGELLPRFFQNKEL